jgi:hypothetical protein
MGNNSLPTGIVLFIIGIVMAIAPSIVGVTVPPTYAWVMGIFLSLGLALIFLSVAHPVSYGLSAISFIVFAVCLYYVLVPVLESIQS